MVKPHGGKKTVDPGAIAEVMDALGPEIEEEEKKEEEDGDGR